MAPFENPRRKTVVAHGRLAMREIRLRAARDRRHGLQVMKFEHLAARLAGGFSRPIENESLRPAIQQALPEKELGGRDGIKPLPRSDKRQVGKMGISQCNTRWSPYP